MDEIYNDYDSCISIKSLMTCVTGNIVLMQNRGQADEIHVMLSLNMYNNNNWTGVLRNLGRALPSPAAASKAEKRIQTTGR